MTTSTPSVDRGRLERRPPRSVPGRRVGFAMSAVINLAGLWIVNHLLAWGWPPFLTPAFDELLPYLNVSLVASAVVNALWIAQDPAWFRHGAQIALNLVAAVVTVQTWRIFPFDLSAYAAGWEVLARLLLGTGLFGLAVGTIVELVRLGRREDAPA